MEVTLPGNRIQVSAYSIDRTCGLLAEDIRFAFYIMGLCYSLRMASNPKQPHKLTPTWKALVEVGFIIFLFYSNLLMGEFTRANGHGKTWTIAIEDVLSETNLAIAIISGLVGYLVFEYLRKRL